MAKEVSGGVKKVEIQLPDVGKYPRRDDDGMWVESPAAGVFSTLVILAVIVLCLAAAGWAMDGLARLIAPLLGL